MNESKLSENHNSDSACIQKLEMDSKCVMTDDDQLEKIHTDGQKTPIGRQIFIERTHFRVYFHSLFIELSVIYQYSTIYTYVYVCVFVILFD